MPKIEHCLISVDLANSPRKVVDAMSLDVPNGDLGFLCPACREPVKPHQGAHAHFEHLERNPGCGLSDV